MDSHAESSEILKIALTGDSQAWDWLFERLWPVATGVAAAKLKALFGDGAVEDAAQNTFVRLTENNAKRLRLFNPNKGQLESYVARVAHNCAIDYLRAHAHQLRSRDLTEIPDTVSMDATPLPMLESWELHAALATLTPRERQVITLLFNDHLETAEAAQRLGVGQDTIRSEKSHALKKLKRFFRQK